MRRGGLTVTRYEDRGVVIGAPDTVPGDSGRHQLREWRAEDSHEKGARLEQGCAGGKSRLCTLFQKAGCRGEERDGAELDWEAARGSLYGSSGDGEWPQNVPALTGCPGRVGTSEVQDGIKSPMGREPWEDERKHPDTRRPGGR